MTAETAPEAHDRPKRTALDWLGLVVRAALLIGALLFVAMAIQGGRHPLELGTTAPDLHLVSYDGKPWDLSRFEGKPVVVNFWGSWCPPCLQELPHFARASKKHADEVVFVGAAVNSPSEDVFRIIRKFDIRYPIAAVDGHTSALWNARSLPSTYLLNDKHEVVWSITGAITADQLDAAIAEYL
jgi:thiol-disulfide isomerase/thioredoxin